MKSLSKLLIDVQISLNNEETMPMPNTVDKKLIKEFNEIKQNLNIHKTIVK